MYKIKYCLTGIIAIFLMGIGWAVPNFTFIHMSDTHAPVEQTAKTISLLNSFSRYDVIPYDLKTYTPAFIIITGDLTEFGEEGWPAYEEFWRDLKIPRYDVLGNHDNTWSALRDKVRSKYGSPYYSFDTYGCHFIILESANVQDPLPGFGQEQITWLKDDLKNIKPETPIFLCFHHPLDSSEFVSEYEKYRLLEIFQPYNLVCILVGHGHSAKYHNFEGFDGIQGGSSFGANPGYNLITISKNTLYVAYFNSNDSTAKKALLEKPIYSKKETPNILVSMPQESTPITGNELEIRSIVYQFPGAVTGTNYQIDGGEYQSLNNVGSYFGVTLPTNDLMNGKHYLRVIFSNGELTTYRTQQFIVEKPEGPTALWRYNLLGSSKTNPVLNKGLVYVGANDGRLYAIDTITGKARWTFTTDGEILTTPTIVNDIVYFGSGDGNLYALFTDGKAKWRFRADSPIYSSPTYSEGLIYFGSKKGTLYALRADDGVMKWKYNPGPNAYTIESKPAVLDGTVYYTTWDSFVYAIDAKSGELIWRSNNAGSNIRPAAKKYFSAGDSNPVLTKSNVWLYVADRDWYLSAMQLETGILSWYTTNTLAVSASEDGESLFVRNLKGDGELQKWSLDGKLLWTSPVKLNDMNNRALRYPIPAVEKNGKVYIASCWGTLNCIDSNNGNILWQYQVTPRLAVISTPTVDENNIVYVTAMDGTLTAIQPPKY